MFKHLLPRRERVELVLLKSTLGIHLSVAAEVSAFYSFSWEAWEVFSLWVAIHACSVKFQPDKQQD